MGTNSNKQEYYLSGEADGSLSDIQHDMLASLLEIRQAILTKGHNNILIMASNERDMVDFIALNTLPLSVVLLQLVLQIHTIIEEEELADEDQVRPVLIEQLRTLADYLEKL